MIATLLQLALLFGGLSLLAFGGGTAVLPDMQRITVDTYHWLTAAQFLDFFAISRAAPGPGSLIVVLIGQKAAGVTGALVAFLAMFGPSCALLYVAALVWHRTAHTAWRALLERALAPVAIGLTLASGLALIRGTEHGWAQYAVTAVAMLAFAFTDVHPLALLAGGAVLVLVAGG
ncbi:MAG TPA: chromate transporter [Acetobacteraceae bacterium]|nr:chromate transporter [Acetobacteraceae bacterium]